MGEAGEAKWRTKSTGPSTSKGLETSCSRNSKSSRSEEVLDVVEPAGQQVVHADDPVTLGEQPLAQVRAQETGAAGDDRAAHERAPAWDTAWGRVSGIPSGRPMET